MSGLSLAVGPPKGQDGQRELHESATTRGMLKGFISLRTIELQLMAFIVVFSASGLVPVMDLLFPVFVSVYIFVLSHLIFPSYPMEGSQMEVFHGSRMFQLYVAVGTAIGLFLPLGYVLGGFARGDQHAVRAATPHLFLLSVQILSEHIISELAVFSPPARVILTLLYSTRRIVVLYDWVSDSFSRTSLPAEPKPKLEDFGWIWFGRWLAAANFIYFNVNMFCFLLTRFLPRAFQRYFEAKAVYDSSHSAKAAHDKAPYIPLKEEKVKGKKSQ